MKYARFMGKVSLITVLCITLLSFSYVFGMVNSPIGVTVPAGSHPAIPSGLKECALKGPDTLESSPTDPVLQWNGYTYWAYSFIDNRSAMAIVAYDAKGNLVQRWDKEGARYIWQITVDKTAKTVTFWGQGSRKITMSWNELQVPPTVATIPAGSHPAIPSGLKECALKGPDTLEPSPTDPVLQWNGCTYWAYSFIDNHSAMAIVAYDAKGNLVQRWDKEGARYIWQITVDKAARTVTFWGQSSRKITMSWDELY